MKSYASQYAKTPNSDAHKDINYVIVDMQSLQIKLLKAKVSLEL